MSRIKRISDKFFNRDDSSMTLTEFKNGLIAEETQNTDVGIDISTPQDFVVNGTNVYQFLTDRGTGRVYEGLRSLEFMSRVIRGVNASSISLFDNKIIAFSADDMRTASPEAAFNIVNVNLGMKEVYEFAKSVNSHEVAAYESFIKRITRQIKAGGFKTEDHIAEALVRVKAIVKSTMYIKVKR